MGSSPVGAQSGDVCLVAFDGDFEAAMVERPFASTSACVAIVELSFLAKQLLGSVVLSWAPFAFARSPA